VTLDIVHAVRSDGFAGVERHIASLAAAQAAAGHRVRVIGGDPRAMRAALGTDAVPHRPAVTVLDTAWAIDRWRDCDILHVHMTAAEVAAVLAVRARRVPVVSTRHFGGRRGSSRAGGLAAPFAQRRIAVQIAISHYVASLIEGESTVVQHGVPVAEGWWPAAQRQRRILVAQRLEAEKATDVAIRAFARAGLAEQGWTLDIAGNGAERPALERLARHLDVEGAVRFLGHRDDIGTLMREAALLLAPCPVEGLGLTLLEAMAVGLPVVAAGAGGHLETGGAADGAALFAPGDASEAARLVAHLAADPALRDRYGAALQSLQRAHFTIAEQARATEAVYRSVL